MADKSQITSNGGQIALAIAANTAAVITNSPGRLCKIVQLGNHSNTISTTIYDNSTGAGGMQVYQLVANLATGTVVSVDVPLANGAYWGGGTNTPAVCITYTLDTPYGR